jgi:hypothetical protein
MAVASVSVYGKDLRWFRTYGGNRSSVKSMYARYMRMTREQFFEQHPNATDEDYDELKLSLHLNKR